MSCPRKHHAASWPDDAWDDAEPSPAELAAIDAEWPVFEAELALLDAEIAIIRAGRARATALDWQRVRTAERELAAAWVAFIAAYLATGQAVA